MPQSLPAVDPETLQPLAPQQQAAGAPAPATGNLPPVDPSTLQQLTPEVPPGGLAGPPQQEGGWLSNFLGGAASREWETFKGQARALLQSNLGMGMDTGEGAEGMTTQQAAEQMGRNIEAPIPRMQNVLQSIAKGDWTGAAVNFAMDNRDKVAQLPQWAQNLIQGKDVSRSLGEGSVDLANQIQYLWAGRGGPAQPLRPPLPATLGEAAAQYEAPIVGAAKVVGGATGLGAGILTGRHIPGPLGVLGEIGGAIGGAKYGAKFAGNLAQAIVDRLKTVGDWSEAAASNEAMDRIGADAMARARARGGVPEGPAAPPGATSTAGGTVMPPVPSTADIDAAIQAEMERRRTVREGLRRQAAQPAAAGAAAAEPAEQTGDAIARQYGYKDEKDAIAQTPGGEAAWNQVKAQGYQASRPVGAPRPEPVTEPPPAAVPGQAAPVQAEAAVEYPPGEGEVAPLKTIPARTPNATTTLGYGGQREGFEIKTDSGARVYGYVNNQDFPNQSSSPTRGEIFYAETPANAQRQGTGTSLVRDALRLMQENGTETVNLSTTSDAGRALVDKLIREGDISEPIQTSKSGKAEYRILGEPAAPETPAQVPVMITRKMRQDLFDLGYTVGDVDRMRPAEANEILRTKFPKGAEPAAAAPEVPEAREAPMPPPTPPGAEPSPEMQAAVTPTIRELGKGVSDAGLAQVLRADLEYERNAAESEAWRQQAETAGAGAHATKGMLEAAAQGANDYNRLGNFPTWAVEREMAAGRETPPSPEPTEPPTAAQQRLLNQMRAQEETTAAAARRTAVGRLPTPGVELGKPPDMPGGFGSRNVVVTKEEFQALKDSFNAKIDKMNKEMHAGFNPFMVMPELVGMGAHVLEGGAREYVEWEGAMAAALGDANMLKVAPYLPKIYASLSDNALDRPYNISVRFPSGVESKRIGNPLTEQLQVGREAMNQDPGDLNDRLAQAALRKVIPPKPGLNDLKEDGERRYPTRADYIKARDEWQQDKDYAYAGVRYDPATLKDSGKVLDQLQQHVSDNLVRLWNKIPDGVRRITMQWYDTVRNEVVQQASQRGLSNRAVAAVYASESQSKDWFMNRNLANRTMDIFQKATAENLTFTPEMKQTVNELKGNRPFKAAVNGGQFDGKTFPEMNDRQAAMFVRAYDETYNLDRSYNAQSPDGRDLGPVQKKAKGAAARRRGETVNADVAWGSFNDIGKAISVMRDDSMENITRQLAGNGNHKIGSFYNNILVPNHPGEYVTIDTHAVGAGFLRPMSQESLEVNHNFSGPGSKATGTNGLYGVYADGYRDAARRISQQMGYEVQPRQVQSVTWEAIRDIFPKEWKQNPANVAKIGQIWKDYQNGEIDTADEAFQKVLDARATDEERAKYGSLPKRWFTGRYGEGNVDKSWVSLEPEELRGADVQQAPAPAQRGGNPRSARGVQGRPRATIQPLKQALFPPAAP